MAFEILPDPLDRVEVRAVRRKIYGLDVMPVESLGLMPTCMVQNEADTDILLLLDLSFLGHGIQEGM